MGSGEGNEIEVGGGETLIGANMKTIVLVSENSPEVAQHIAKYVDLELLPLNVRLLIGVNFGRIAELVLTKTQDIKPDMLQQFMEEAAWLSELSDSTLFLLLMPQSSTQQSVNLGTFLNAAAGIMSPGSAYFEAVDFDDVETMNTHIKKFVEDK